MNIVFIALDTLRADHMSCYGYYKKTTPHIDALAKKGVLFKNMIAENNVTQSSFVTMFTGKNPLAHGVVNMRPQKINPKLVTLNQIFKRNGYKTAAVDNNHRCTGTVNNWFKRGYDMYFDPGAKRKIHFLATAEDVNQLAIPWLKKHRNDKFFLFLHYWDPHFPYKPPAPWNTKHNPEPKKTNGPDLKSVMREPLYSWFQKWSDGTNNPAYVRGLYDGEVGYLDHHVGQLVDQLHKLNLFDKTLIVLVGDHGESLGEHRIYFDHHGLYEPTVHVPFIMVAPSKLPQNKRVSGLCQHADILPTVLQIAGIKAKGHLKSLDGKSLAPLISGKKKQIHPFVTSCEANWQLKRAIRTTKWKLIKSLEKDVYGNPRLELYNLQNDPGETKNLALQRPAVVKKLNGQLETWVKQMRQKHKSADPLAKGQKTRLHPLTVAEEEKVKKRLSDLGY